MERNYVNMHVNPCKMCMPMGASLALKGFKKTMTIIHGSQGCATYIRRHISSHYNEPIDIASSSLSEEGTVYGGAMNLKIGISNLVKLYQPEIVGILTTCLAETIGDDIHRIVKEVRMSGEFDHIDLIPIATPGYGASEAEGYFAAVRSIFEYFGEKLVHDYDLDHRVKAREEEEHINIIVSNATSEDVRELKRILKLMGIEAIFLPDSSDVLDAPYTEVYDKLNDDGISREEIKKVFRAKASLELGHLVSENYSPAMFLEEVYQIPAYRIPLPIGMKNTDLMIDTLLQISGKSMPNELKKERGRLLDSMIDAHKHSAIGRCAIFGDMDLTFAISSLAAENGMSVGVVATGAENKRFSERLKRLLGEYGQDTSILQDTDFETIHKEVLKKEVNVMIGHSGGRMIWEKEGIPLVRVGFPIHDHIGAQKKLLMGYKGSSLLLLEIVNQLLDGKHKDYRKTMRQTYYKESRIREEILW